MTILISGDVRMAEVQQTLFGEPPVTTDTPHHQLWSEGVSIAIEAGRKESAARYMIGKLCKEFEPLAIIRALRKSKGKDDPIRYAQKLLNGRRDRRDGVESFINGES